MSPPSGVPTMTFSGLGMYIFPILVGGLHDAYGSYYPGFIICAVGQLGFAFSWSFFCPETLRDRVRTLD